MEENGTDVARHCPYCKKITPQKKQSWGVSITVFACTVCKLLNWEEKEKKTSSDNP